MKVSVVLCALALSLLACEGPKSAEGGGPQGRRLDTSRYPMQENSPYGGWLAQDYMNKDKVRLTVAVYMNQNEMGVALTCSAGIDSITAAATAQAMIPMTNSGTITVSQPLQDSVQGTLAGQPYNCAFALEAGTHPYTVMGEAINVTVDGQIITWKRIR